MKNGNVKTIQAQLDRLNLLTPTHKAEQLDIARSRLYQVEADEGIEPVWVDGVKFYPASLGRRAALTGGPKDGGPETLTAQKRAAWRKRREKEGKTRRKKE